MNVCDPKEKPKKKRQNPKKKEKTFFIVARCQSQKKLSQLPSPFLGTPLQAKDILVEESKTA
jgi:hypothetical protein